MKVIIVGGGLSGLTTSYLLSKKNIQVISNQVQKRLKSLGDELKIKSKIIYTN